MKKAAVFILLGQSNAVGHNLPMDDSDKIITPLKNVFGLNRDRNQSFDITKLTWSGYTSNGMNLGEDQDHTYSIANCLASLWQNVISKGHLLPDLYIVQIAIGAQGVIGDGMWNPQREKVLIPGKLGVVDISLFPFTLHILSLLRKSLLEQDLEPDFVGLHWRGSEQDMRPLGNDLQIPYEGVFREMLDGFCSALGTTPPIVLHRLVFLERIMETNPSGTSVQGMEKINRIFDDLAKTEKNISVFDPLRAPHYIPHERQHGIFLQDAIHFNEETNKWVAECILKDYFERN